MRWFYALTLACSLGCASTTPAPAPATAPLVPPAADGGAPAVRAPQAPVPLAQYLETRRLFGGSFSPDDKLVAYQSDEGGRPHVSVHPTAGGPATQLTHLQGFLESA